MVDVWAGIELGRSLNSTPIRESWVTPRLVAIREPDEPPSLWNDLVCLPDGHPILSIQACRALALFLATTAELLPIETSVGDYKILNVTNLVPALIEERSEVFRYPSGGMGMVQRYELDPRAVAGNAILKLTAWPAGATLVGQSFVDFVRAGGLTGFEFTKVWEPPN